MNFLKTSFWASISTGVTMLCGLITTKYVAMMIGPEGMAYVGQFSNSTVLISLFASAACISGVVKYIAEYKNDFEKQKMVVRNALSLILLCTLCCSLFVVCSAYYFSRQVFNSSGYAIVFLIYALLLVFPVVNGLMGAILNGMQQIKKIAFFNVTSSLLNVVFILLCAKYIGIKGVLVAGFFSPTVFSFIFYFQLKKMGLMPTFRELLRPEKKMVKLLLGYSAMAIVSGVIAPSVQLAVRSHLLYDFNAKMAGLWQANMRLSDYYLNFVATVLSIYYLPKLSGLVEKKDLKKEIGLGYLRIMPIVIVITIVIWLCRHLIINILLTKDFTGMLVLLKWQLIGDVIKIASFILSYFLVAKAMKKSFIVVELTFAVVYVVANYIMVLKYGFIGTAYAFVINYALYFLVMLCLVIHYFQKKRVTELPA